ncbi:TrkH family potassium uptake protein [Gaoshiqia sp. Z1-71]|uniref:TrkH family potassium uptake protein n=1 Tax=Gaoshiqia hydrogeniformans TaxID=3290090 RepID=UPI003BF80C52
MRFNNLLLTVSLILMVEGLSFLMCIPSGIYYHEPLAPFYLPAFISLLTGCFLFAVSGKKFETITSNRESILLISVSWLALIVAGSLPYLVSKTIPSLVDVFFETTSGFTTTGSSVLTNTDRLPKSILFWRSLTHWLGGIGTILMFIVIFPSLNIGGYQLFSPEEQTTPGPAFVMKRVVLVYGVLTAAQVVLLYSGGMNLFESFCYAFGAVSTGCFSPQAEGLAAYPPYIQYLMAFFMLLSGVGYIIFYFIVSGKFRIAFRNEENRIYLIIFFTLSLLITGIRRFQPGGGFESSFREGIFQTASVISSSGYSLTDYSIRPDYLLVLLFFFLLIGGCTGSAAGGIKMSRFLILFRNFSLQFRNPNAPSNASDLKYNRKLIGRDDNLSVLSLFSVFGITFLLGTIILSLFTPDFGKSAFLSASALTTFGHRLDLSCFPDAGKITLSILMLLGRLEIYPLLLMFAPSVYRKMN